MLFCALGVFTHPPPARSAAWAGSGGVHLSEEARPTGYQVAAVLEAEARRKDGL